MELRVRFGRERRPSRGRLSIGAAPRSKVAGWEGSGVFDWRLRACSGDVEPHTWLVLRLPEGSSQDGLVWFLATSTYSQYGHAQYPPPDEVGPGTNPGWIAYPPGTFAPSAMRVLG